MSEQGRVDRQEEQLKESLKQDYPEMDFACTYCGRKNTLMAYPKIDTHLLRDRLAKALDEIDRLTREVADQAEEYESIISKTADVFQQDIDKLKAELSALKEACGPVKEVLRLAFYYDDKQLVFHEYANTKLNFGDLRRIADLAGKEGK